MHLLFFVCLLAWIGSAPAASLTLYDDLAGGLPAAQGELFFLPIGGGTQTPVAAGINLVTSAAERNGYSNYSGFTLLPLNPAFPALDRASGYALTFELKLNSEAHSSANRAGFSVIALGSDHQGIELGFWTDTIWAQNDAPIHTHGEQVLFDTSTAEVSYRLDVLGSGYSLKADNIEILSGGLRDYTASTVPFVYTLTDYLYLGDNTTSAQADITLGSIAVHTHTAVPLPAPLALLAVALAGLAAVRPRRRIH